MYHYISPFWETSRCASFEVLAICVTPAPTFSEGTWWFFSDLAAASEAGNNGGKIPSFFFYISRVFVDDHPYHPAIYIHLIPLLNITVYI